MNATDMILLGFSNLRRTKLRTFLTILGVVIGIGALTSMVSFGTGMQKNITDAFSDNDMFTSLTVTSGKMDIRDLMEGDADADTTEKAPLTDSLLGEIKKIRHVAVAFPEVSFAARVETDSNNSTNTNIKVIPSALRQYKPYSDLLAGHFISNDSSSDVVLTERMLKNLKMVLQEKEKPVILSHSDSVKGIRIVQADSVIGKTIRIATTIMDFSGSSINPLMPAGSTSFKDTVTELVISGILKNNASSFGGNIFQGGGVMISPGAASAIPRMGFTNVWQLLNKSDKKGQYDSFYVRVEKAEYLKPVIERLKKMNVRVISVADELKEINRVFLIINSILGVVGTIALIVAALGIINTMIMSIMERRREIGIMISIGASENQIKSIFFVEAAFIGFIGALLGIILGWLVTRLANFILNTQLMPSGEEPVDLFYFPWWLIIGAIAFSIFVSLIAGLYPAIRAARIDPVKALRHD